MALSFYSDLYCRASAVRDEMSVNHNYISSCKIKNVTLKINIKILINELYECRKKFCIDPALNNPEMGSYELLCKLSKLPMSYHLPALEGVGSLQTRQRKVSIAAVIILGSYASVHDYYIWQEEFRLWLSTNIQIYTLFGNLLCTSTNSKNFCR